MNILVLVGTNPYSFDRLVRAVEDYAKAAHATVFIQLGNTTYEPQDCQFARFVNKEELNKKMVQADVVITHGGFGSIKDGLAAQKPVIAIPRQPELGESQDYQEELVQELAKEGLIIPVLDVSTLPQAIAQASHIHPSTRTASRIPDIIRNYLAELP